MPFCVKYGILTLFRCGFIVNRNEEFCLICQEKWVFNKFWSLSWNLEFGVTSKVVLKCLNLFALRRSMLWVWRSMEGYWRSMKSRDFVKIWCPVLTIDEGTLTVDVVHRPSTCCLFGNFLPSVRLIFSRSETCFTVLW